MVGGDDDAGLWQALGDELRYCGGTAVRHLDYVDPVDGGRQGGSAVGVHESSTLGKRRCSGVRGHIGGSMSSVTPTCASSVNRWHSAPG